jgi:hypothetical protein
MSQPIYPRLVKIGNYVIYFGLFIVLSGTVAMISVDYSSQWIYYGYLFLIGTFITLFGVILQYYGKFGRFYLPRPR